MSILLLMIALAGVAALGASPEVAVMSAVMIIVLLFT